MHFFLIRHQLLFMTLFSGTNILWLLSHPSLLYAFYQFYYDVLKCVFLFIIPAWKLLRILDLQVNADQQTWEYFYCFFKYIFWPVLFCFSYLDSKYTYIRLLNIAPQLTEFLLFSLSSLSFLECIIYVFVLKFTGAFFCHL